MKSLVRGVAVAALVLVSQVGLAGEARVNPVPTLGESGLVVFALSLVGGGVVLIRRRRR